MSDERVKCINTDCNVTIQLATVARYGGLCGRCSLKKDAEDRAEYIRLNRRRVDAYEGITDPVAILRIMRTSRKFDPLIEWAPAPMSSETAVKRLSHSDVERLEAMAITALCDGECRLAENLASALAAHTTKDLVRLQTAWLEHRCFVPAVIFRHASPQISEQLTALMTDDSKNANAILMAMAWIGDENVREHFEEWDHNPPIWRKSLYVDASVYASTGGWELMDGRRHDLCFGTCYALELDEEPGDGTVKATELLSECCPWCQQPLVKLLEFDLQDPRFKFLELSIPRLPVIACEFCTPFDHATFMRVDEQGNGQWHPANKRPQYLRPREDQSHLGWLRKHFVLHDCSPLRALDRPIDFIGTQIGGHPSWEQDAIYPTCPDCEKTMLFVAQFDQSQCDSEGFFYAFVCRACHNTAVGYQQT